MMSPRACGTSPGNMGQVLHLYTLHGAGQGVLHAGRWQVPMLAWLVRTEGGRSLKRVTGPQRQRQVHCRLANFCSGLPGPTGRWQVPTAFPNSTGDVLVQFAGMWHVTAIASNCSIFLKMKDGMKSSMVIISFMPEGDMAMKLVWPL